MTDDDSLTLADYYYSMRTRRRDSVVRGRYPLITANDEGAFRATLEINSTSL